MKALRRQSSHRNPRAGGALIVALITMTVVASLGATYVQLVFSTTRRQSGDLATLKAFYIAEAGLEEAFHGVQLGRSGQVASIVSPARFGGGLVWVNASQTKDNPPST
ncbi:MAG: hypothetical protein GY930_07510 [bacterium]|nr:hypothetical protein [bacterium]